MPESVDFAIGAENGGEKICTSEADEIPELIVEVLLYLIWGSWFSIQLANTE